MAIKTRPSLLNERIDRTREDYRQLNKLDHDDPQVRMDLVACEQCLTELEIAKQRLAFIRQTKRHELIPELIQRFLYSDYTEFNKWWLERPDDEALGQAGTYQCPLQRFLCERWGLPSWSVMVGEDSLRIDDGETAYETDSLPTWCNEVIRDFDGLFAEEEPISKSEYQKRKSKSGI
ncbi:MAG: hypothetical protein P4L33_02675 [Capsulimonadaceae bacterium]|nr:hypothetical protein [Capsulimonadaceae bacterium]